MSLKRAKRSSIFSTSNEDSKILLTLGESHSGAAMNGTHTEEPARKKQKVSDPLQEQLYKACKDTLEDIKRFKDSTGRQICKLFLALPSKKLYPDYYLLIKNPISLSEIGEKLNRSFSNASLATPPASGVSAYQSLDDFKADLKLMFDNACTYNVEGSVVYQDAKSLLTLSDTILEAKAVYIAKLREIELREREKREKKVIVKDDETLLYEAIDKNDVKSLLDLLKKETIDINNLKETTIFGAPFSWSPLHFACYSGRTRIVAALIEAGADVELKDTVYKGTALAWAAFGDQIKTAKALVREYNADRNARNADSLTPYDLVQSKANPEWLEIFPDGEALVAPDEYDESDFDSKAVLLAMYFYLLGLKDQSGRNLCEFFVELPTRRDVPNYYSVIKSPMCFKIIERRFFANYYTSLGMLAKDIEQIFVNAMSFNGEGSIVYQDARRLKNKFEIAMDAAKLGKLKSFISGNLKFDDRVTLKIKPPKVTIKLPTVNSNESISSESSGVENQAGNSNLIFSGPGVASAADEDEKKKRKSIANQQPVIHIPAVEIHEQKAIGSQYQQQYIKTASSTSEAFNPPILSRLEIDVDGECRVFEPAKASRGVSISVGVDVNTVSLRSFINQAAALVQGSKIYHNVSIQSAILNTRKIYPRVPTYVDDNSSDVSVSTVPHENLSGKVVEHDLKLEEGMNCVELVTTARIDEKFSMSRGVQFESQQSYTKQQWEIRQVFRVSIYKL